MSLLMHAKFEGNPNAHLHFMPVFCKRDEKEKQKKKQRKRATF